MTQVLRVLNHPSTSMLRPPLAMIPFMMAPPQRENKDSNVYFSDCLMSFWWRLLHFCVHQMKLGIFASRLSNHFRWFQKESAALLWSNFL